MKNENKKNKLSSSKHDNTMKIVSPNKEKKNVLSQNVSVQKIVGFINFDNLKIKVYRNILVPRYETQEVVNEALKYISKDSKVLDLCCGSGYIGLTIKQKTDADVTLSDIYEEAILQAKENAKENKLKVKVIKSDLFKNIGTKFDVIISNAPYIHKVNVLSGEDQSALLNEEDFYKEVIKCAPNFLNPGGYLILEISPDNIAFIKTKGFKIIKDINKKERIAIKQF